VKDGLQQRVSEFIGIYEPDLPAVRIIDPTHNDMQKFQLSGDSTADSIIQFYEDWSNKLLKPYVKSQDIPEKNDDPVKVIIITHSMMFDCCLDCRLEDF
jgi:hypothetical protein